MSSLLRIGLSYAVSGRPTKAALAAAKARGTKLGGPKLKQAQRRGIALEHDEAALGYAAEMANKLWKSGGYNDPS